jgi:hypothetical protein
MAVSQFSFSSGRQLGDFGGGRGLSRFAAGCPYTQDGELKMASKPATKITPEMQQLIAQMIARMSLRG